MSQDSKEMNAAKKEHTDTYGKIVAHLNMILKPCGSYPGLIFDEFMHFGADREASHSHSRDWKAFFMPAQVLLQELCIKEKGVHDRMKEGAPTARLGHIK